MDVVLAMIVSLALGATPEAVPAADLPAIVPARQVTDEMVPLPGRYLIDWSLADQVTEPQRQLRWPDAWSRQVRLRMRPPISFEQQMWTVLLERESWSR